ncbi:MAG: aconitate hydratase AcnA [Acidobacteria bacterium]|nr:aconitate hydratase AcnA [Acidobacteriota bacterium]
MNFEKQLVLDGKTITIVSLKEMEAAGMGKMARLPFSIRVLLENLARNMDGKVITETDVRELANWQPHYYEKREVAWFPARVVMQDFTGVPAVVDLAVMRDALQDMGGDLKKVNPMVPVDLIVDHSVQVDFFGSKDAYEKNLEREYQRNGERYQLLKWARSAFDDFRIFPPGSGIVHQVNLEYLASVVTTRHDGNRQLAFPDTLIGTDSHTTMINGISVLGWGVGGIEAEAVMLGQPYYMTIPEVVGVRLTGKVREGVTTTDVVLAITEKLRHEEVVEKFVEYFGPGVKELALADRATIANMAPEYGATCGFFPIDQQTLAYLRMTDRNKEARLVEAYAKAQDIFFQGDETPDYSSVVEVNLNEIVPAVAGPSRPQDRVILPDLPDSFDKNRRIIRRGSTRETTLNIQNESLTLKDGSVVIAAITSCTNTSNPAVMIAAGLLAKKAVEAGLTMPSYVKTSLAPGSRVVTEYLEEAGLLPYLEKLGFNVVGYGCTTCIGNSGPLPEEIQKQIVEHDLVAAAVLSGNRNFEARINPYVKANYLASPPLVIAFALAGRVNLDLTTKPLAFSHEKPIYLKDLWPANEEIQELISRIIRPEMFREKYSGIMEGNRLWQDLPVPDGDRFQWAPNSSYIRKPPFFEGMGQEPKPLNDIENARCLLSLGDSVTTDHISPAGAIPADYPAGRYLQEHGVPIQQFNTYGSRRGNHEVMMRGTFANVRIKNKLAAPKEGGYTRFMPGGEDAFVFDAAMDYQKNGTPLIVLAGREYGTGSSRDWAAKGTQLLGAKAVLAVSYERIHRSNLVGMGVLPLQFKEGENAKTHGLSGKEEFTIRGLKEVQPGGTIAITSKGENRTHTFEALVRLDTDVELQYFRHGGILPYVLRQMAGQS